MKIHDSTDNLFLSIQLTNSSKLPYLENFKAYREKFGYSSKLLTLYDYIFFVDWKLNEYYKYPSIQSFQEFLDFYYPPKKNRQ